MDSFKVRVNFKDYFILDYITATDEEDACWKAKALADKFKKSTSFDLMYAE